MECQNSECESSAGIPLVILRGGKAERRVLCMKHVKEFRREHRQQIRSGAFRCEVMFSGPILASTIREFSGHVPRRRGRL